MLSQVLSEFKVGKMHLLVAALMISEAHSTTCADCNHACNVANPYCCLFVDNVNWEAAHHAFQEKSHELVGELLVVRMDVAACTKELPHHYGRQMSTKFSPDRRNQERHAHKHKGAGG